MTHSRYAFLIFISLATALSVDVFHRSQTACAENFYVSLDGDDDNPGTKSLPWRTVSASALRLAAGDCLLVQPGDYEDEGKIFVREVDPETFEYLPLEGSKDQTTQIRAATRVRPRIHGSFDIRGSHILLSGLKILGDEVATDAGIGVFESHNITVKNCYVAFHGGGGIQFNHSDLVKAIGNTSCFNATTNPDQHSGISSFQPVVRTDTNEKYGVVFSRNVCFENRNEVPSFNGNVTDGNGIIVDDHLYSQFNGLLADVIAGASDPGLSSGDPRIDLDVAGNPLPYERRSLVYKNICADNGGRGVHVFLSDNVLVARNYCVSNLDSQALLDTLPTDDDGNPFFVFGEITVADSTRVTVSWNIALADKPNSAAAAELFFDLQGVASTNRWRRNKLFNSSSQGPRVSVANSDSSQLLPLVE